jgi:hypothetical protein
MKNNNNSSLENNNNLNQVLSELSLYKLISKKANEKIDELKQLIVDKIEIGDSKTAYLNELPTATISKAKTDNKLKIIDDGAFIDWAKENMPDAIETKPVIKKTYQDSSFLKDELLCLGVQELPVGIKMVETKPYLKIFISAKHDKNFQNLLSSDRYNISNKLLIEDSRFAANEVPSKSLKTDQHNKNSQDKN